MLGKFCKLNTPTFSVSWPSIDLMISNASIIGGIACKIVCSSLVSVNELPDDDDGNVNLAARGDISVARGDDSDCDETVPKQPAVSSGLRPTTARGEDSDAKAATERAFAAAAARDDAAGTPVTPKPNSCVNHGND